MIDLIDVAYVEKETEVSWQIESGAVYDEILRGQWHD